LFELYHAHAARAKDDLLSGLTVALALVPEAVAFAFVAGVQPLTGLYAAFTVGLVTSLVGGRPGMISGATGALAVVMVTLVGRYGVEYLFATVVLMGVLQVAFGLLRLGKFIRMVPLPVMLGFVNGLAIVIFLAQLEHFKVPGSHAWLSGAPLVTMLALVALTMAIMYFLPRFTRAIPSGLAAITVTSLVVILGGLKTKTVGDISHLGGGLPPFHIPNVPMDLATLKIIVPYAVILAIIGLSESLLTMTVIDEMTETRGRGNRVSIGQGLANVVTGLFSGMGGCAMIGQSMININSGGRRNLSGLAAALFLLGIILFASPLIERIPVAALVGVMFMVVIGTFEWGSFRLLGRIPPEDTFVGILVAVVTVATDLAVAVTVHGPIFFASVHRFGELFDPAADPADRVIVDFAHSRVADHSAIEAIDNLAERYVKAGKQLQLRHLSAECRQLLARAGDLVEVNISEDPHYHVADDRLA